MTGRMGKSRNIFLVWLVWPLITLGIYHLVVLPAPAVSPQRAEPTGL